MRPRDAFALAAALAVAVGAVAACSGGDPPVSAPPTTTATLPATTTPPRGNVDGQLTIGILLPITGPGAALGMSMTSAIELAVQEINAVGGVNGRPVLVAHRDEGGDAATAALALDELITKDDVDAVVGPASSKVALAVVDKLADAKVVTCSPTATAIALTDYADNGYFFRTMPSDALQAVAMGRAIDETGRKSTAILYPDDDYGRAFTESLSSTIEGKGGTISAVVSYDPTATDFSDAVTRALANRPEAVAVIGLDDPGGKIIAALLAAGVKPPATPVFVSDGMRSAGLFDEVSPGRPESVAGIEGTAPSAAPAAGDWFSDAYDAYAPSTPDLFGSYAYDCTNLIALSAQAAGTDDPSVFKELVVPTSSSGVTCRNFPDCAELLTAGRNIDLDGASGAIELTTGGDPSVGRYDIFKYGTDGKDTRTEIKTVSQP